MENSNVTPLVPKDKNTKEESSSSKLIISKRNSV